MPSVEDSNPYFNVKDWGRSRGGDFGFGLSYGSIKYEALFYVQVQDDPQFLLSVSKEELGGPLVVLPNESKNRQIWKKVDFGNHFVLVNKKTGNALQVNGEGQALTTSPYRLGDSPAPSQLLKAGDHKSEGYISIRVADNNCLVLGLSERHAASDVQVQCKKMGLLRGYNQFWRLIPAGTVYTIRPKLDIAFGLAVQKADARGGLVIERINCCEDHFATWYVIPVGPNEVKLINSASGWALKRNGLCKQIEQADANLAGRDIVWIIGEDTGGDFFPLHPALSPGESADVNGSTAHSACKVRTVQYGKGDDQIWGFFPLHRDVCVDPLGRDSSAPFGRRI